jgi:predicted MFS family arabinose efflux permease
MGGVLRGLRPASAILLGAMLMLSLSMGLRQSLGLFMPPLTRELGISVSQFTLAVAVQNLTWGVLQPFAGAAVVRWGYRPVMLAGAMVYLLSMPTLSQAGGLVGVIVGAGIGVGVAVACTANAVALAIAARSVATDLRSTVMGVVSAGGSVGALIAAPLGQAISQGYGWRAGLLAFTALALLMLPGAWLAGRVDRLPALPVNHADEQGAGTVLRLALTRPAFLVMALAYFVCGMQLIFLTTHLPSYLDLCGMDPMLGAQALAVIGGFNVLGSLFFGWAGGRWNKQALLGGLYMSRSLVLAWYFSAAPTPTSTLVFAAIMGFLWLGVSPLIAGSVVEMFGLRWQAMVSGLAFMSHQLGSFTGAFGGGVLFDFTGSYELAWRFGVGLGLTAGAAQLAFAIWRPQERVAA